MSCSSTEQSHYLVSYKSCCDNWNILTGRSALLVRLVLAFDMEEATGPSARRPNTDMLDFSDVYNSLVACPRKFDCHYIARDAKWLETKMSD